MRRFLVGITAAATMAAAVPAFMPGVGAQQPDGVFTSGTSLVVLHVTVEDRRGGWVPGLDRAAFSVFEDRRPQAISLFLAEDTPATVGLIIDNSISMHPHRDRVVAAAGQFARAHHPDAELFSLVFNELVEPVLPGDHPFTSDAATFERAVDRAISARGQTAFFDAVSAGMTYAARGRHARRVLVVVSDGGDNASLLKYKDLLAQAPAANVVIYGVALVDPLDRDARPNRIKELARITGGSMFVPQSAADVADALTRIAAEIRHTYTIGYTPDRESDGSYRTLRVIVTPPQGRRISVRTRAGYVALRPGTAYANSPK